MPLLSKSITAGAQSGEAWFAFGRSMTSSLDCYRRGSGRNDLQVLLIRPDRCDQRDTAIEGGQPAAHLYGEPKEVDVRDLSVRHSRELEATLVAKRKVSSRSRRAAD